MSHIKKISPCFIGFLLLFFLFSISNRIYPLRPQSSSRISRVKVCVFILFLSRPGELVLEMFSFCFANCAENSLILTVTQYPKKKFGFYHILSTKSKTLKKKEFINVPWKSTEEEHQTEICIVNFIFDMLIH